MWNSREIKSPFILNFQIENWNFLLWNISINLPGCAHDDNIYPTDKAIRGSVASPISSGDVEHSIYKNENAKHSSGSFGSAGGPYQKPSGRLENHFKFPRQTIFKIIFAGNPLVRHQVLAIEMDIQIGQATICPYVILTFRPALVN